MLKIVIKSSQTRFPEKERRGGRGKPIMKTPTPVKINKKSSISMLDLNLLAIKAPMIEPIAPKVKMVAYAPLTP